MPTIEKIVNLQQNKYFSQIIFLDTVSSTQDYLKKLAVSGKRGIVCLAKHQTNGRGRAGRAWACDASNLKFSMLFDTRIDTKFLALVSLAAGIATKQTIEKIYGVTPELKWPNDILLNGKKLCGIISEAATQGNKVQWVVSGLGVNTNMKQENVPRELAKIATSLFIETGRIIGEEEFLKVFLGIFSRHLDIIENGGARQIVEIYQSLCNTVGKTVKIILDSETKIGKAKAIDDLGNIIVETGTGEESFCSADVVHLR